MNDNVFQHFESQEHPFIEQVEDWNKQVNIRYEVVLTPFLNLREQWIIQTLYGNPDEFSYRFNGGYDGAENKRCLIYPLYEEVNKADFKLQAYEIHYQSKFNRLTHGQIMGTILGAGIQRNRLGDIISDGHRWQFIIEKELGDFVQGAVHQIGRTSVYLEAISLKDLVTPVDNWLSRDVSLSSYRLDTVLAEGFHLSRQKAKGAIEAGQVKKNWVEVTNPASPVQEKDVISFHHHGRLRLDEKGPETKKGKHRARLGILKSK